MNIQTLPILFVVVYSMALAALAITGLWTAFIIVAVIGGPLTSVLFWMRSRATPGSS